MVLGRVIRVVVVPMELLFIWSRGVLSILVLQEVLEVLLQLLLPAVLLHQQQRMLHLHNHPIP